jgi:hypothetical protein
MPWLFVFLPYPSCFFFPLLGHSVRGGFSSLFAWSL